MPERPDFLIPYGASMSQALDFKLWRLIAVRSPAILTQSSDRLIFHGSDDGTNFYGIRTDAGGLYTVLGLSTTVAYWHTIDRHEILAYRWLKIQVVTSDGSTPVVQGANRLFETIRLHAEGM